MTTMVGAHRFYILLCFFYLLLILSYVPLTVQGQACTSTTECSAGYECYGICGIRGFDATVSCDSYCQACDVKNKFCICRDDDECPGNLDCIFDGFGGTYPTYCYEAPPTAAPTVAPTAAPTTAPTVLTCSAAPTMAPTPEPTPDPTPEPTPSYVSLTVQGQACTPTTECSAGYECYGICGIRGFDATVSCDSYCQACDVKNKFCICRDDDECPGNLDCIFDGFGGTYPTYCYEAPPTAAPTVALTAAPTTAPIVLTCSAAPTTAPTPEPTPEPIPEPTPEPIIITEITGDGLYDVSKEDAGNFGMCDFRISMDIRGKGPGTKAVHQWTTSSGILRDDGILFVRSTNPNPPYDGPTVLIYNNNTIEFRVSETQEFFCNTNIDFTSVDLKHLEMYRSGTSLTLEIDGNTCQETIEAEPDSAFISNAPLRFRANHVNTDVQNLNLDLYNIKYTTSCRDHFLTPVPNPEPTPEPTKFDPNISGDPHIKTWSNKIYDFHGVCDLVLLQNPDFQEGLGMDIHVRTKQIKKFSYVSAAALRIGGDILEVMGDVTDNLFWINKQPNREADDGIVGVISGYPISYTKVNSKQHEFTVKIGGEKSITMKTFKTFVQVSIHGATEESFGMSLGMLGSYRAGEMVARDKHTVMEDTDAFGQEWQVFPVDGMLFHNVEGPQAPEKCDIPMASNLRRRLAGSDISEEEAKIACTQVSASDFDMCVFDVMATGEKDIVGAY